MSIYCVPSAGLSSYFIYSQTTLWKRSYFSPVYVWGGDWGSVLTKLPKDRELISREPWFSPRWSVSRPWCSSLAYYTALREAGEIPPDLWAASSLWVLGREARICCCSLSVISWTSDFNQIDFFFAAGEPGPGWPPYAAECLASWAAGATRLDLEIDDALSGPAGVLGVPYSEVFSRCTCGFSPSVWVWPSHHRGTVSPPTLCPEMRQTAWLWSQEGQC